MGHSATNRNSRVSGVTPVAFNVTSRVSRRRDTRHVRRAPVFQPHRAPVSNRRCSIIVPRRNANVRSTNPTTRNAGTPRNHGVQWIQPTQGVSHPATTVSSSTSSCQAEALSSAYNGDVEGGSSSNCSDDSGIANELGDNVREEVRRVNVSTALSDHSSDGDQVPDGQVTAKMIAADIGGVIDIVTTTEDDDMHVDDEGEDDDVVMVIREGTGQEFLSHFM